jgi:hypothetical protein
MAEILVIPTLLLLLAATISVAWDFMVTWSKEDDKRPPLPPDDQPPAYISQ